MKGFRAAVCATLAVAAGAGTGAGGLRDSESRIILEHADTLRSRGTARELVGHVRIRRGDAVITADRAVHYPGAGLVNLSGEVRLVEPGRTIRSRTLDYRETSGDFDAAGEVVMTSGDSIRITCPLAQFHNAEGRLELLGGVQVLDLRSGARVTGRTGRYMRDRRTAEVEGDPVYTAPDTSTSPPETLVVTSRRLVYHQPTGAATFTGQVKFHQGRLRGQADTLRYLPDSSLTVLSGNPYVWSDSDEMTGATMRFQRRQGRLERLEVEGEVRVFSAAKEDPLRRNTLIGKHLAVTAPDDTLRRVRVDGDARAYYHIWDEDGAYQGVNLAAADRIRLQLVGDRVREIVLDGRANGRFYPPHLVPAEMSLYPGAR